jgi:hypothetical protein
MIWAHPSPNVWTHGDWSIERVGHGFQVWRVLDPRTRLRKKRGSYASLDDAKQAVAEMIAALYALGEP